jgi:uncharacterized protein YdhG (YjbR/CyaY superfamily)
MPTTTKAANPSEARRRYLAAQPPATRRVLKAVRDAIRAAAPDAVEVFSYGIPGFRLAGKPLVWYAGWTEHVSVYPMGSAIRKAFAKELAHCETSTGTVRFPLTKPPSATLVKRLVKARIAELRAPRPLTILVRGLSPTR